MPLRSGSGTPGVDGIGLPGVDGATGVAGAKGDTGAAGANGIAGTHGSNGAPGASGKDGASGPAGKDGVDASTHCLILTAKTKSRDDRSSVLCTVGSVARKDGARATLSRNGKTIATDTERKGTKLRLVVRKGAELSAGTYRLARTYRQAGRTVTEPPGGRGPVGRRRGQPRLEAGSVRTQLVFMNEVVRSPAEELRPCIAVVLSSAAVRLRYRRQPWLARKRRRLRR